MSKLVICEKPSVAKSIASALGVTSRADGYFEGGGWLISWCIGHLVGLADAAAYDDRYKKWRYEDLPILPAPFRYVVSEEKAAQFHILRSLMERPDVTELVNACDAGREGELIFRLVYEAAGCSKPFSRLWISSMEDAGSGRVLPICAPVRTMIPCTSRHSAAKRRTGLLVSMPHGSFRCCIIER